MLTIQAAHVLLRTAICDCVKGERAYSPALAHRHARQRLSSGELVPLAKSLVQSMPLLRRAPLPKEIVRTSRMILEEALPLVDYFHYEPNQELPERSNTAHDVVHGLIDLVYRDVRQDGLSAEELVEAMAHELGRTGIARTKVLVAKLGDDDYFLTSSALVGAAILESRRLLLGRQGAPTMGSLPRRPSEDIGPMEA